MQDDSQSKDELSPLLSGVAGEYFVAAELSARGYIASITLRNTKGVDILCSNSNATKTVSIQVKTNRRYHREWMLNEKAENYQADSFFYVFVNLNGLTKPPDYFIVPSKTVAAYAKDSHKLYMETPGRNGQMHNVSPMRKFIDPEEQYLNQWSLLGL
jgi:hypothetical protein